MDYSSNHMSVDDMWNLVNMKENSNFGIPGYDPQKVYFDPIKNKYDRETWEMHSKVWSHKDSYPKMKLPVDKDGKEIIPKRPNFIEEHIKSSKANFSQEKYDKFIEKLKEKGTSLEELEGIRVSKKKEEPKSVKKTFKERCTIIAEIINNEKKTLKYTEKIQELVDKTKERHQRYSPRSKVIKPNFT